jgi:hypothetical protein
MTKAPPPLQLPKRILIDTLCCLLLLVCCAAIAESSVVAASNAAASNTTAFNAASSLPKHLVLARELVAKTPIGNARYQHQSEIRVDGEFAERPVIHTDCSGLVSHVLQATKYARYGTIPKKTPRSRHPLAEHYYDAIVANSAFTRIRRIEDLREGDLIAWKFVDRAGKEDTGHVLIVNRAPVKVAATSPIISDTTQYELEVIDSSRSPHSPDDTRTAADRRDNRSGLGKGRMRLYQSVNDDAVGNAVGNAAGNAVGNIAGYAYFTSKAKFHGTDEVMIAAGRVVKD